MLIDLLEFLAQIRNPIIDGNANKYEYAEDLVGTSLKTRLMTLPLLDSKAMFHYLGLEIVAVGPVVTD